MDRVAAVALFIRIVETRSLSKAAVDFGIAHANATKAGAAVEQRLGARLLLPTQEIIAVFPSPKLVPSKVNAFIEALRAALEGGWWDRAA